jgi:predicted MFS family arabinose efflux permease
MNADAITGILLLTDGMAIVAAFLMSQYYARQREKPAIFTLYIFFTIVSLLFFLVTFEDVLLFMGLGAGISDTHHGLFLRTPITFALLWMVHRSYGPSDGKREG